MALIASVRFYSSSSLDKLPCSKYFNALGWPCAAACSHHALAAFSSFGTPRPFEHSTPRRLCAAERPCSADKRNSLRQACEAAQGELGAGCRRVPYRAAS
jgi:hypothetical protein